MEAYIFIDRENSKDLAVVYPDEKTAREAVTEDIFIEDLCQEDAVDCYVSTEKPKLSERNIIPRNEVEYVALGETR